MARRTSWRGLLSGALLVGGWMASAHAGDLIIAGSKNLACRNLFKADHVAVDDLSFELGGLAKGLPGDGDVITLFRPNQDAAAAQLPDVIGAGIAADKPAALTVTVGLWCMKDNWDFGRMAVYWNDKLLGVADSNLGEKKHRETFTFKVPAESVKGENCLWMQPLDTYTRRVYFDAAKISGDAALKLLDARAAKGLLLKAHPMFAEARDLKGKGKVLIVNEFARNFGLAYYEVAKALNADVTQKESWVSPREWKDYKLVILHGRFKSAEGEGEAIGEYLNGGGNLMISSAFAQFFATGKGTAWAKLPWTGGYAGGWSRLEKPGDHFFILAQDSPLLAPGLTAGARLNWSAHEMDRFVNAGPGDPKETLLKVDCSASPLKGESALFVHPVGQGKLIGYTDNCASVPDVVVTLRNIVADVVK